MPKENQTNKEEAHETLEGYCCACDYDQAVFEDRIQKGKEEATEAAETKAEEYMMKARQRIIGVLRQIGTIETEEDMEKVIKVIKNSP